MALLVVATPASATAVSFNYTGAPQTWTVPAGATSASFDLFGGQGGPGNLGGAVGLGGRATATIPVTPGDSIQVYVGGQGQSGAAGGLGGFNGGASGGTGGGGGASDIRVGGAGLAQRVLVAGGGGAAGGCSGGMVTADGGGGGGETGDPATGCGTGGGGGTQTAGGSATSPATAGTFGAGGDGESPGQVGGGGGGGWYGGGGGASSGAGGGGSGHGPAGTVFETGVRSGDGVVTVNYTANMNDLGFGKPKQNANKGIAHLPVDLPAGGQIGYRGQGESLAKLSGATPSRDVEAGRVWLKVKPGRFGKRSAKIRRALKRGKGAVRVKVFVTYLPSGGSAMTKAKQLNLIRK